VVTRTAAEISFEFFANGFLVEAVLVTVNDSDCAHDHAWRAETTLKCMIFSESFLHWVQIVSIREAFDCSNVLTVDLTGQDCARFDWYAINVHCAGTTL